MLLKPHHSLAQLRVRLINCWMSALKAKVSAMAAKVLPGSRISAFFLRSQSFAIHPFEPPKANCGSHTTFGAKMTGDEWAGSRSCIANVSYSQTCLFNFSWQIPNGFQTNEVLLKLPHAPIPLSSDSGLGPPGKFTATPLWDQPGFCFCHCSPNTSAQACCQWHICVTFASVEYWIFRPESHDLVVHIRRTYNL